MGETATVRESRKDAQRNRTLILDAAREAFFDEGVEVSMNAIAKKAGVGAGTLYRNFPSKEDLLAALMDLRHASLEQARATIAAQESHSGRALERWIDALGDWMLAYQGLPEPLRAACDTASALSPTCHRVIETTEVMLRAAQDDGHVQGDLRGRDIFLGALSIAWASNVSTADERTRTALRDVFKHGWAGAVPRA